MKNIFKLLLVSLIFTACEDVEPTIYNSNVGESPTFLSFSRTVYSLPVVRDGEGTLTITLNSSTVSSVDRTYGLEIVDTDVLTTADPSTYTFPSSITIPAGSYQGTAVVTGVDNGVTDEIKTIDFIVTGLNGESMDVNQFTINVAEVCPLEDDFTGQYVFSQSTSPVNGPNGPIHLFPQNQVVTVEMGESEFERVISTTLWPSFFNEQVDFIFTLNCGVVNVSTFDIGYGCVGGGPFTIAQGSPAGFYTADDDSVITITVSEDATASCLNAARNVTFTLTKVE